MVLRSPAAASSPRFTANVVADLSRANALWPSGISGGDVATITSLAGDALITQPAVRFTF